MSDYPRYAIYFVPPQESDLDCFGKHLLGYDAYTGEDLPFPESIEQAIPDWRDLTRDPRKYGFHATLKAPFFLKPGSGEADLLAACEKFVDSPRDIPLIEPVVAAISGFLAVVPLRLSTKLAQLAADCTGEFDIFRAPLTAEDRTRRNPSKLTPRQLEHLDRWGYPYVMQDFRFHMTLTGHLDSKRCETIRIVLHTRFAALQIRTLAIDRIAVFRQNDPVSRFRVLKQYELKLDSG